MDLNLSEINVGCSFTKLIIGVMHFLRLAFCCFSWDHEVIWERGEWFYAAFGFD